MNPEQNQQKSNEWNYLFKVSLLIYPITLIVAILLGNFVGINSDPIWNQGSVIYGQRAVEWYLIILGVYFAWIYIPIIIYQIGYVVYKVFFNIKDTYFK